MCCALMDQQIQIAFYKPKVVHSQIEMSHGFCPQEALNLIRKAQNMQLK